MHLPENSNQKSTITISGGHQELIKIIQEQLFLSVDIVDELVCIIPSLSDTDIQEAITLFHSGQVLELIEGIQFRGDMRDVSNLVRDIDHDLQLLDLSLLQVYRKKEAGQQRDLHESLQEFPKNQIW